MYANTLPLLGVMKVHRYKMQSVHMRGLAWLSSMHQEWFRCALSALVIM